MKKILMLCILFPQFVYSQTITVKQDGTGDYTSIQNAIDNASNGDTVLVWPGTYYENVNYLNKGIILGSLTMTTGDPSYISQTIINGNQSGCCIYIRDNNHVCEVNGFILTNGSGTNDEGKTGGGIYIVKSLRLYVNNCIIEENQMVGDGGGIYCVEVEEGLYLSGTTIRNNQVFEDGGGIVIGRSPVYFDSENLCNIYLNYAAYGNDIAKAGDEVLTLNLDTFTVINPDKHFIINHENEENIILNINNGKIQPVNSDLYVNPTGSNDNTGLTPDNPLRNISFALIKTLPDTNDPKSIYLSNGTYAPSGGEMFPFALRGYVNIIGESRDSTILDGEDTTFIMQGNEFTDNYQVKNLTIFNANSNLDDGVGAFSLFQNHNATYENMVLTANKGLYRSAISVAKCNNLLFKNLRITQNIGGNAILVIQSPDSNLTLYSADTVRFLNCDISNNIPDFDTANKAYGGGLAITGFDLYHDSLTAYITNCLISENVKKYHASRGFSGLLVNWGAKTFLTNSTIGNNTDENVQGACIVVADNSELNVYNSIIYDNFPAQFYMNNTFNFWYSDLNIYNSLVQDGLEGIRIYSPGNTILYDSTNINADPLWANTGYYPYMLSYGSPCINTGTLDLPEHIELPETDLAGNPRVYDGQIDMGAYEFGPWVGVDYRRPASPKPQLSASPNPFHHETRIRYQSKEKGKQSIFVYDIGGNVVATLMDITGQPGQGEIIWDGRNDYGRMLPAGVYVVEFLVNDESLGSLKVVKK